jgi:hypothetical protein
MLLRLSLKFKRREKFILKSKFASKPKPEFDTSYKDSILPGWKMINKSVSRPYTLVGFLVIGALISPFAYGFIQKIIVSLDPEESKYTDIEPIINQVPSSLNDIEFVSKKLDHFLAAPEEGLILSSCELNTLLEIIPSLSPLIGLIHFDLPYNDNQIQFYTSIPMTLIEKKTKEKEGSKKIEYINTRMSVVPKKNENSPFKWEGYISSIELLPVHKYSFGLERKFKDIDFFDQLDQDTKQFLDKIDHWYVDSGEIHINSKSPVNQNDNDA